MRICRALWVDLQQGDIIQSVSLSVIKMRVRGTMKHMTSIKLVHSTLSEIYSISCLMISVTFDFITESF